MHLERIIDPVSLSLLSTWRISRRWLFGVGRSVRNVDVRKPLHALVIGSIIGGAAAPVLDYWNTQAHYALAADETSVMTHSSKQLGDMLSYDKKTDAWYFNKDGQPPGGDDQSMTKVGSGGKKQVYSAEMPAKPGAGIKMTDTQNKVSATMTPQYALMDGRDVHGRMIYPMQNDPGVLSLTPKGNGMKEDIVLNGSPADRAQYDYKLALDDGLVAKMMSNGGVGVYSADPSLYGNITFSSDKDKALVEKARQNSPKNYLVFEIPAPVVKQADGKSHGVKAHFMLNGNILSVVTTGLSKASYPLSIDPSFVITTQSDWLLGKVEDNITVTQTSGTDYQLNRATITAGLVGTWGTAVAGTLPTTGGTGNVGCADAGGLNFNFGLTAYNGFLYLVGGGNGALTNVCYAALNTNGTLGAWTVASHSFLQGRIGATVLGFNGFLYVLGGEDGTGNTQYTSIEYAQAATNGDVGVWCSPTGSFTTCPGGSGNSSAQQMETAHTYGGGVTYNGFIYMCGGATVKKNGGLINTCEFTQINSDGSLAKPNSTCTPTGGATVWCATSSFTTARNRFKMASYNGYIYLVGGYNGTNPQNDVQYVSIKADYSLASWATTTPVPTTLLPGTSPTGIRDEGVVAEEGHLYIVGGCSSGPACGTTNRLANTLYVPIYADGTIGSWDTTNAIASSRFMNGATSYNGYLYNIGGCTAEPNNANNCTTELGDSGDVQITQTPGDVATPTTGAISAARAGVATAVYNGSIFAVGGCNGTSCGTFTTTVDKGTVNNDGTITWTTVGQTALSSARAFGGLAAYANKLFYIGGLSAAGTYSSAILDGTLTSGSVSAWATDASTISNAKAYFAVAAWKNYVYVVGGTNGTTWYNDVQYTAISGGAPSNPGCGTTWCGGFTFTTGVSGVGAAAYAGYLYIAGGQNSAGSTVTTVYKAPLTNSTGAPGTISSTSQTALPSSPARFDSIVIHNNVIYALGGVAGASGSGAASSAIAYAPLDSSTGNVTSWTTSSRTLSAARWGAGAVAYNGRLVVVGGCTSTGTPPACTTYSSAVDIASVRNGGNGTFSGTVACAGTAPWCTTGSALVARSDAQSVAYNANIYVVGGCKTYNGSGICTSWATDVQHATIQADGSLSAYTSSTVSPPDAQLSSGQARMRGALVAYVGRIFLIGGTSSTTTNTADVISAALTGAGNVDTTIGWRTETSMTDARSAFSATVSGGRVYVAGGNNGSGLTNSVEYSEIGENGTLLGWTTDPTNFTTARQGLTALAYNSKLYVIGGVDGSNNSLADIQFATINSDGSLGSWSFTTDLDLKGKFRQAAAANGYMYFFGSENSDTDVFYAAINSNGTLGNLYRASSAGMTNAHAHGTGMFSDGFFYEIGGCAVSGNSCTTATPSTTSEYAGQKAQARIGHYSKMFNTEVNTSPTLVQVNGTGQFIITLRTEAVGTTVWGTPQFISPAYASKFYFIQALDSSGTNVGIAFNYYLFLIIDDENTGTFPDTGSVATDADIFYHPNPGRRLRHGASFTNTGCNGIIANGCLLDTATQ